MQLCWICERNRCIKIPIMHELKSSASYLCNRIRVAGQSPQYASSTFGCLKRYDATSIVARWNRLGLDFSFLQLINNFETSSDRVLQRRHAVFQKRLSQNANEQSVLMVLNNRYDALLDWFVWICVLVPLCRATGPSSAGRIDAKSENALFLTSSQPLV